MIPKVVTAFRRHWWASFNSYKTPLMIKPYNRALGAKENNQTSLRPVGNAPPLEPIRGDEFYNSASQNGKPYNWAGARWKFLPLWYLRYHLPTRERWNNKATISSYLISIARKRAAKTSTGGSTAVGGDRGVFPCAAGAVCLFSIARQGDCMVFPATSYQPLN